MARSRSARTTRAVTARTAARRARKLAAEQAARPIKANTRAEPETLGQARVWSRKRNRYMIAGLCDACAAHAAWGHAEGFQHLPPPCSRCLPLVAKFPHPGPRKSPWRKILDKLEYFDEADLDSWFEAHCPDVVISENCDHAWCADTGTRSAKAVE